MQAIDKDMIAFIVAAISEFAAAHRISVREANNYLMQFKGLDFLTEHYAAEHLLSFDDCVHDLTQVCLNNGGIVSRVKHGQSHKIFTQGMNKRTQYLVEGITKDIIAFLMQDNGYDLPTALRKFYNSTTFVKLSDEATGLYIESSAYVYEILKDELKHGKLCQMK